MGILDRRRISSSHQESRQAPTGARGLTGVQLLEAADLAYSKAEQEFDRSLETRETLEHAYLAATQALDAEQHPQRARAWLGLATIRRYQKGRRDDALAAYDEALAAAPEDIEVWDAYLDYITYAVSAAALLAIVERMPAPIRAQKLPHVIAVGQGADRWGTMSSDDQRRFTETLPALLEALDDRPSLGALLSTTALHEHRNGSHAEALQLMRRAAATGFPSPACVDRLTIELVKLGKKAEAARSSAMPSPAPSRRTRCAAE